MKLFDNLDDFMTEEQKSMVILCDNFQDFKNKFNVQE